MTFTEYSRAATATAVYPKEHSLTYIALGICGEAGELANKIKKIFRDGEDSIDVHDLRDELGDILWYVNEMALYYGMPLEEVAKRNIIKLSERRRRGTLHGSGDDR